MESEEKLTLENLTSDKIVELLQTKEGTEELRKIYSYRKKDNIESRKQMRKVTNRILKKYFSLIGVEEE